MIKDSLPISFYPEKLNLTETENRDESWFNSQKSLKDIFTGGFEEFRYYFEGGGVSIS